MIAAALAALMAAAPAGGARAGAALVPADAEAALLLDGARGAKGLAAFFDAAGAHAGSLSSRAVGSAISQRVGLDPLHEPSKVWGLAPAGPRALVATAGALGLSAPVADVAAARRALATWLGERGPSRKTRPSPLAGPSASGQGAATRAGLIAPVAGAQRLLTASGVHAAQLVSQLAHVGARKADTRTVAADASVAAALAHAPGPAVLWTRRLTQLPGSVLSLEASASGLVARGRLLPAGEGALLVGAAPAEAACGAAAPGCVRAGLGGAGRALAALALQEYLSRLPRSLRDPVSAPAARAVSTAGKSALRIGRLDVQALAGEEEALQALELTATAEVPGFALEAQKGSQQLCARADGPRATLSLPCGAPLDLSGEGEHALEARLDFALVDRALAKLTPLDALRGSAAAAAYAAHLLYGDLLRHAGPLTLSGNPAPGAPAQADIELRLPLR